MTGCDDVPCYVEMVGVYTTLVEVRVKALPIYHKKKTGEREVYFVDLPALFRGDETGYAKYAERVRGIHRRLDAVINRC